MNKPQYLAELSQLLIFMTRADRDETLARYGALFDAAGPAGQDALLTKLGTTTRQAIRLSRIYNAGGYEDEYLDALEANAPAAPESEPEAAPEPQSEAEQLAALIEDDLPQFDLDDLPDLASLPAEPEPAPERGPVEEPERPEAEAAPEAVPSDTASAADEDDADYEELWGKRPAPQRKSKPSGPPAQVPRQPREAPAGEKNSPAPVRHAPPAYTVERVVPLWLGIPLFALSVVFLVLPLAVVCLLLVPTLLIPGVAVLLGAFLAVVGGLWCISIVADAAVLFGTALILLALGLIILWCGLWLDVAMVSGFIKALVGLGHLTLGKKVADHA